VAAEQAFLAANGQVQDLGPTNGLGTAPATNPGPTGAPTITNPTGTGARNPQNAIEVGTNFTLDLNTRPGGMLTLPAGVDFVSATNGAVFDPATRTIVNTTGGTSVLTLRGTQPGSVTLQASDVSLPGGPVPAGTFQSGPLTLAFQTPVSAIAPPPAALVFTTGPNGLVTGDPALGAFGDRSLQIVAMTNLPAPLGSQLMTLKQAVEVPSLTEPTQASGILSITPAAAVGAATDPSAIVVDSGPALGSTSTVGVVPVIITEVTPPTGFALDTSAGQSIPVGFSACLAPATTPAPGSPAWTITTGSTADGRGTVTTATLRDVLAAVVVPPVTTPPVTPPVTTPPVVPPVTTPPPVVPPVTTPPVTPPVTTPPVTPPVTTPPVVPPVVTPVIPAPVVTPVIPAPVVTPVVPAPVVTPAPIIPAPVVTPTPAPGVAIAVPVTPAPAPAPSTTRVTPPRGIDAGLAADQSSGTGQRLLGGLLGLTGLAAAGGLLARRRRH